MNAQESCVFCVLCEMCSDGAFKQFSNVTKKADGSVAGGVFRIFSGFMDHCDCRCFPGQGKITRVKQVVKRRESWLKYTSGACLISMVSTFSCPGALFFIFFR